MKEQLAVPCSCVVTKLAGIWLVLCLFATSCTLGSSRDSDSQSPEPAPSASKTAKAAPFRILAYATEAIPEDHIPYDKLTHLNYSFLIPNRDGTFRPLKNPAKLTNIVAAARQRNVAVCISVGGWGWDSQFEEMATKAKTRAAFVRNLEGFVREFRLDGVDMDWEYPAPGKSSDNFLALIRDLRKALQDKILTTAVISYGDRTGLGMHSDSFPLFDFINVMTYDGRDHGTMEQFEKGLAYWSGRGVA